MFTPEVSDTYYINVSTYRSNPELDNSGSYTVTVTGMVVDPTMGMAINGTERVPDDPTTTDENEYVSGNDKLKGTAVDETINGLSGDDTLYGMGGNDVLNGGKGNDLLVGGSGGDELNGGDGNDTIDYSDSPMGVIINLNDGMVRGGDADDDTIGDDIENVRGSAFDDDLTGGTGDNKLWGLDGNDTIEGGAGDDTIEGGMGKDDLDGGYTDSDTGTDGNQGNSEVNTLSYAGSNAGVTINLGTASANGGHATDDTIATYEELSPTEDDPGNEIDVATFANVTGSKYRDHLTGNHHDNELTGGAGDDTLKGGASDAGDRTLTGAELALALRGDVLVGGPGEDVLDGGEDMNEKNNMVPDTSDGAAAGAMVAASVDWAAYWDAMEGVMVDLSNNSGTGGEAEGDTLINIELIWGSKHADTFIASDGADTIEGDGGSDTVSYEASEMGVTVNLSSATQHRTVLADVTTDPDNPVFHADDGESGRPTPETVARPTNGVPKLNAAGEVLTADTEDEDTNPNVNGAAGDRLGSIENLTGSAMGDSLTGDANPNVLKGMGGKDTLSGGAGKDTLDGGAGDDTLYGELAADSSTGAGDDMLMGGAGDDTLFGGDGDDTLTGGSGNDDLTGGAGADTFVFSTADAGDSDAILDFGDGGTAGDKIDLSAFELTAEQVIAATTLRGTGADAYVVINLEAHGGGRITIDDVSDLDDLDSATGASADGSIADQETDGAIQDLDTDIFIL